jgi:hypothetical protein
MNTDDIRKHLPEQLDDVEFDDNLALVGTLAGGFLVLAGLGTVAGTPWTHKASLAAAAVQVLGALATAAVGAGLVWLSQQ